MKNQVKTVASEDSVQEFLSKLTDTQRIDESATLINLMVAISGCEPKMWGPSIIGFDTYHYMYESGREGDMCIIGFSPRKNELSVYFVDGLSKYEDDLQKLGKHRRGKACLYIKRLADIDMSILEQIVKKSYVYTKNQDGKMHRAT